MGFFFNKVGEVTSLLTCIGKKNESESVKWTLLINSFGIIE